MSKRYFTIVLTVLLLIVSCCQCFADYNATTLERTGHDRENHDMDIEYVLFGEPQFKASHPNISETIQLLEDATYLCVDQFNGSGTVELDRLKQKSIPELPQSISEIDFTSNYFHRYYTHRGWNLVADNDKSNFVTRKRILQNTVRYLLFENTDTPVGWFPWLSNQIYGYKGTEGQIESFCILLYNIHLLGDHMEAAKYTDLAYTSPLVRSNNKDNPGIIPEILSCLEILFENQRGTFSYIGLMQELDNIKYQSERILSSQGGVNTDEKFAEYHKLAAQTLMVLSQYVPTLLRNETFFHDAFYKGH